MCDIHKAWLTQRFLSLVHIHFKNGKLGSLAYQFDLHSSQLHPSGTCGKAIIKEKREAKQRIHSVQSLKF